MPSKKPKQTAFTVAVSAPDEAAGAVALQLYVAMAPDASRAIEAVRAVATPDAAIELSGTLSDRLTTRLKLRPGEVRPI
ncbi:hypothetical protein [Methylobacterium nodulans]|uniref:Uncharacterized protein n=1 Tax=Methylobacterium nodulans (strain LMG 21967 / CNCM I-2342 / ORS 2060) TaxID=460265 RepID=B8IRV9_METNO|nr:hypothetical protein [Methylobacterium nodulans]ACL60659.1 conserved hypothetical protein [Methylobacterium nodulans ORS 2060]